MTETATPQLSAAGVIDDPLAEARRVAARAGLSLMAEGDWPDQILLPPDLSLRFLRTAMMLPLGVDPVTGAERVAMTNPDDHIQRAALSRALGRPIAPVIASIPALVARIDGLVDRAPVLPTDPSLPSEADGADDSALDAPTVALLDRILSRAVEARATDIHFEPGAQQMAVRQRVDGMLRLVMTVPAATGRALVARLKILAGLNIAERRLAQDGQIRTVIAGQKTDIRCATLPMIEGEGATLRLLAGQAQLPMLNQLGLTADAEQAFRQALDHSNGLILVTGPTGCGKTTTLASATAALNVPTRKIISIEDPVEYQIPGISQVQVNAPIGLTFAAGLRAFMRADPDVLLVGEVRDRETAAITVQAALTGHLVLTTLHTNSAAGAVVRLTEMGIERYLLAATLRLSIGQRLVRQLCRHCRRPDPTVSLPFPPAILARAGGGAEVPPLWQAGGCNQCGGTGYFGRAAIFEVLTLGETLRKALLDGAGTAALHQAALAQGMVPLLADGLRQVLDGRTSIAEVVRVVQDD